MYSIIFILTSLFHAFLMYYFKCSEGLPPTFSQVFRPNNHFKTPAPYWGICNMKEWLFAIIWLIPLLNWKLLKGRDWLLFLLSLPVLSVVPGSMWVLSKCLLNLIDIQRTEQMVAWGHEGFGRRGGIKCPLSSYTVLLPIKKVISLEIFNVGI